MYEYWILFVRYNILFDLYPMKNVFANVANIT